MSSTSELSTQRHIMISSSRTVFAIPYRSYLSQKLYDQNLKIRPGAIITGDTEQLRQHKLFEFLFSWYQFPYHPDTFAFKDKWQVFIDSKKFPLERLTLFFRVESHSKLPWLFSWLQYQKKIATNVKANSRDLTKLCNYVSLFHKKGCRLKCLALQTSSVNLKTNYNTFSFV